MRKKISLNIENNVINHIELFPSYGIYSMGEDETGLFYDRSYYKSFTSLKTSYPDYLGGYDYELKEGTIFEDWQSGVDEDLQLNAFDRNESDGRIYWNLNYKCGNYYIYDKEIYLNSNSSSHISMEEKTFNFDFEYKIENVRVAIWKRTKNKIKIPWKVFKLDEDLASKRKKTFFVKDNSIEVSENFRLKIGTESFDENFWENKNSGSSSSRYLFLDYFPVSKKNLKVVAKNIIDGSLIELKESKSILQEETKDHYYEVDRDLGIIRVGNYSYKNLITAEPINTLSTKVSILNVDDLKQYPDKGYIYYNEKKIYYEYKGKDYLEGIIYNGEEIPSFSELELAKKTYDLGNKYTYYVSYEAIPRVDFEIESENIRDCNKYIIKDEYLNLKPSANYRENGIVQLNTMDRHVEKLHLEVVNGKELGQNYFEATFNFYEMIKATVHDSNAEGVEDILVTFVIEKGPGEIGGAKRYQFNTNNIGEALVGFFAGYSFKNIKKEIVKSEFGNETVFTISEEIPGLSNEDVQLYEVLKIDPNEGTNGIKKNIVEKNYFFQNANQSVENKTYIKIEKTIDEDFNTLFKNGVARIKNGTSNHYFDEEIESIAEGDDGWYVFLKSNYNSANISVIGNECYLIKGPKDASLLWSANSRNGLKRLVYKWNEEAKHPITKNNGAYYPVRPYKIAGNKYYYSEELKEHKPYDQSESLGDYIMVAPALTTIYAYCTDPFSGKTIVSNRIKLKLVLPRYLNGVDFEETLPVPYGFRLKDSEDDVSGAIGGKTFLTVNPETINKLSLNINMS